MYNPVERENEIMKTLRKLSEGGLGFVVVGGYAVSAFRHRFSVDADIVTRKSDRERFEEALKAMGYRKTISKRLKNEYSSEFERYEKKILKVSIDLFLDGIGVRQTGASFGFDFLLEHSTKRTVMGAEETIKVNIPSKEILVVLKLHSGRLTDFRDVAALSFGLDTSIIKGCLFRGNRKVLRKHMERFGVLIEKPAFQDSFKGVFMEKDYRIDLEAIRKLARLKPI